MNQETRFHSLDALRAGALLLGVALHAAMSFLPGFRELRWPISDDSTSMTLAVLFFVVHIFRMAVFFLIAGFFARLLMEKLGPRGFIRHRLRRVALPLLASMIVVMPLVFLPLWLAHRLHPGALPMMMQMPIPQRGIPWGHLWFLYLLLVLYALALVVRAPVVALDRAGRLRSALDAGLRRMLEWRVAPLLLAAPLCAALYYTPWWQQWGGVPAPILGFIPNFPAVLAFGSAMLVGWMFHRQQALLALPARDCWAYLVVALVASAVACRLVGPEVQAKVAPFTPAVRLAYAASYTLALWCWCFALVGIATRFFAAQNARWRYLADASYWLYLTHVPVVWLLQVWMMKWPLHWAVKYALILALAMGLLLTMYHHLVRNTFVGQFLNGRRYPRAAPLTSVPSTSPG